MADDAADWGSDEEQDVRPRKRGKVPQRRNMHLSDDEDSSDQNSGLSPQHSRHSQTQSEHPSQTTDPARSRQPSQHAKHIRSQPGSQLSRQQQQSQPMRSQPASQHSRQQQASQHSRQQQASQHSRQQPESQHSRQQQPSQPKRSGYASQSSRQPPASQPAHSQPAAQLSRQQAAESCAPDGDDGSDSGSLADALSDHEEDAEVPPRVSKDFQTLPDVLRNRGDATHMDFPTDPYTDPYRLLHPHAGTAKTMDGVHKCLQLIPEGDPSLLTQPSEGYPWVMVARCIGSSVPEHIEKALYFFYRVLASIEAGGYTRFVVPTQHLVPQWDRHSKKAVVAVAERQERVLDRAAGAGRGLPERRFSIASATRKRMRNLEGDKVRTLPPFTIRMGFTGAFFHDGVGKQQELYCMLFVTPLRNFDLLAYITESFLAKPKPGTTDFKTRHSEWSEFSFIWSTLLQYELDENMHMGMGADTAGELGPDYCLSMLMLPLKVHEIIARRFPSATQVRIIGFPELSFQNGDDMVCYMAYLGAYVDHQSRWRAHFEQQVDIYNRCKDEARDTCVATFASPGGWPRQTVARKGRQEFRRFGLPPVPLLMWWCMQKSPVHYLSFEAFKLNIGKLPQLATVHLRKFLTFDSDSDMGMQMQDSIMLTDNQPATPFAVSMRYYSELANPLDSLFSAGCLLQWWIAIKEYTQRQRDEDKLSPEAAMEVIWRYLGSGMESHRGMILSGQFRSSRVKQGLWIVEKTSTSPLGALKLKPIVRQMAARVPESIRHDAYLRMSSIFFLLFEDINQDFVLNAGNLEFLIEMNISSMHWLVGSHNATFKWFFQGLQVVSGNGHYLVSLKDFTAKDTRKPNSVGADFVVDKANKMQYSLGEYVGISKNDNCQVFINANRWTPVGLENQGCVEIVDNVIVGYPSPDITKRPIVCTEMRNADLCAVIKSVYPRNADQKTVMINTVDANKTNQRSLSIKHQIDRANFSGKCTNCLPADKIKDEEFKTMMTVIHLMVPGSPAYVRSDPTVTGFNAIHCDKNQSRDRAPEEPRRAMLTKLLTFSHVFAACLVALPNSSGIMPFEISDPVLAFLDWLFLYIRNHLGCVLDVDVMESFNRMKEGYESRHVVYTIWRTAMLAIAEDVDPMQGAMECIMSLSLSALAVTEV